MIDIAQKRIILKLDLLKQCVKGDGHVVLRVRDLLNMDVFTSGRIVAGFNNLDNIISGVTIIADPDIRFFSNQLNGGEFVLTSLYTTVGNYENFIRPLVEKKISVLTIKIRRFVDSIPKELIDHANELGLPIIELDANMKDTDIMYPIMRKVFDNQVQQLKYYKEVHEKFISFALEPSDLTHLIKVLKSFIDNPIAIFSESLEYITSTEPCFKDLFESDFSGHCLKVDDTLNYFCEQAIYKFKEHKVVSQIVFPIEIQRFNIFLAVYETERSLDKQDFITIKSAITAISLTMIHRYAIAELEQNFQNELVIDLVKSRTKLLQTILDRANILGWDVYKKSYVVAIINISHHDTNIKRYKEQNLNTLNESIYSIVLKTVNRLSNRLLIGIDEDSIIFISSIIDQDDKQELDNLCSIITRVKFEIQKVYTDISLILGMGNLVPSIAEINKSYREAQDAIAFAKIFPTSEIINRYAELGLFKVFCQFPKRTLLAELLPTSLAKLKKYDKDNDNNLIGTLEVFLECNCNSSETAKKLGLHYRTVLYRLGRIKKLGDLDLNNEKERLEIHLGIKLLRLIQNDLTEHNC